MLQKGTKPSLKTLPSTHRWLSGDQENDILGHEFQNLRYIAISSGTVPRRDQLANGLFVTRHRGPMLPTDALSGVSL